MAKMNKHRGLNELIILILVVAAIISTGAYLLYANELKNKPAIKDKFESKDYSSLYDLYVRSAPNIAEREYYGSKDADIYIIAFLDTESPASRQFISEIFPKLKEEFIDKGKVKYYGKNYITMQDLIDRNSRYTYGASLLCLKSINAEKFYPFYFGLFNVSGFDGMPDLIEINNISQKELNDCINSKEFKEINEDVSEIESFGMVGLNQRFYIGIQKDNTILDGVPDYTKFQSTIRQYLFMIGGEV